MLAAREAFFALPEVRLGFAPGPRELVLWVAPHLRAHADVAQLERWLIEEMSDSLKEMTAFLQA